MFTEKEISLMRRIGLNYNFDNLSDEEWCNIEDVIGDYLTLNCLNENYDPNSDGLLCESILAKCE